MRKTRYAGHPLQRVWAGLKERCSNPNHDSYKYYGGKGIRNKFEGLESFGDWALSNGWKKGLQIDRIDENSHYCPENCRIVTKLENIRSRECVKMSMGKAFLVREMIKFDEFPQKRLAKIFGVHRDTIGLIVRGKTWL